jgi:hypothetical protein
MSKPRKFPRQGEKKGESKVCKEERYEAIDDAAAARHD